LITSAREISVVIPTFNRIAVLRRAIQSVLSQTCPPGEILVVDDGSNDGTQELIKSDYHGSVIYILQSNSGVSHARNTGITLAKGKWIALLDSDDEWMPGKLEMQIQALNRNPDFDFCHTNEIWIRNGKRVNAMDKHEKSGGYVFEKCLPRCVISPSAALIRKSVFDRIGLFDDELPACEDYDLWLRYCCSQPVLYIDTPLIIKYGGHSDQLSRKYWGMDRFRLHALLKLVLTQSLSESQVDAAVNIFNEKLAVLIKGAEKRGNNEMLDQCRKLENELKRALNEKNNELHMVER